MPKTDEAPEPLTPDEASRMSHLLGKGETIAPEEHAELRELHAKATVFVKRWEPDAGAAMTHMVGVLDTVWGALSFIAGTVPAAGGIAPALRMIRAAIDGLKNAAVPPNPPPELPPKPPEPEPAHQDSAAA